MTKRFKLKPGMKVLAKGRGRGVIIGPWGSFQGCLVCTNLIGGGQVTRCCGREPIVIQGDAIFDVMLEGGHYHPFHKSQLTLEVAA